MLTATKIMTAAEVAEHVKLSQRTIQDQSAPRGDLPCFRIGRLVRYSLADVELWLERRREVRQ